MENCWLFQRFCRTESTQDQNKLTIAAYAALLHLHNRHGDRCTFCATKSLKKVNSSRFTDFIELLWMVCNGFLHRLHVVRRRVDERRACRPTKIAGVCGFSAVEIFMEGCRLFQKRQKTAFWRSVWRMTVPLHKLSAGNVTTDAWGTHRWVSGTRGCKIKIVMYLLVKVGRLWLRPCFPPSIVSTIVRTQS